MSEASEREVRRVVVIDENDKSKAIADGPTPDVRTDPARPGFSSSRMWLTDSTPARVQGIRETVHAAHTLEPPPNGSVSVSYTHLTLPTICSV